MTEPETNLTMMSFFAAVSAVEDGKVAEVEVEHRILEGEREETITLTVRREVRHFVAPE